VKNISQKNGTEAIKNKKKQEKLRSTEIKFK